MKKIIGMTAVCLVLLLGVIGFSACGKAKTTESVPKTVETVYETQTAGTSESEKTEKTEITSIRLKRSGMTLSVGESAVIEYSVIPKEADGSALVWSCDDLSVATVDGTGRVTGVANGTANVLLSTEDGHCTARCQIVVGKDTTPVIIDVEGVSFNKKFLILVPGASERPGVSVTPSNATDKSVTYSVENETVASVGKDGKVTALTPGVTKVRAAAGEKTAECVLVVSDIEGNLPEDAVFKAELMAKKSVDLLSLDTICKGLDGLKFYSENISVLTVRGSVATGESEGTATVTVADEKNNLFCRIELTVTKNTDPLPLVTGVRVDQKSIELCVGQTAKVTATVQGSNPTGVKVTWIREKNIETGEYVYNLDSDGTILATSPGWAYVTAYVKSEGKSYTSVCKVTVKPAKE